MPKRNAAVLSMKTETIGNLETVGNDETAHFGSFALSKKSKRETAREGRSKSATAVETSKQAGPFPGHSRPSEAEARAARDSLALLHGEPKEPDISDTTSGKAQATILDSLVRTILSQNTTDTNSHRTFANLKAKFADWEAVRLAETGDVEAAIKMGGLAATKTVRIQVDRIYRSGTVENTQTGNSAPPKEILNRVKEERGTCSLEHLRVSTDEEIKQELLQYSGVGPKTVACVLMFCLGRYEFPVDTHVWRIAKSLGWVPQKANREQTYKHLNERIPADVKYALHVLMVEHGKRCPRCAKNSRPRKEVHGPCPLSNLAAAVGKGERLSSRRAAEEAQQALEAEVGAIKEEQDPAEGGASAQAIAVKIEAAVRREPRIVKKEESGQ